MIQDLYSKKNRFENFVVIPSNVAAFNIFKSLADNIVNNNIKGQVIYLLGETGTGKSHLISALANEISDKTVKRMLCTSAYEFCEEMKHRSNMRSILWKYDVLIAEDIQDVADSEIIMEEFLFSIDYMIATNKLVIITGNKNPDEFGFERRYLLEPLCDNPPSGAVVCINKMDCDSIGACKADKMAEELFNVRNKIVYQIETDHMKRSSELYEKLKEDYFEAQGGEFDLKKFEIAIYSKVFSFPYAAIVTKEEFLKHFATMHRAEEGWKPLHSVDYFSLGFENVVDYGRANGGSLAGIEEDYLLDILHNYADSLARIEIDNYEVNVNYA